MTDETKAIKGIIRYLLARRQHLKLERQKYPYVTKNPPETIERTLIRMKGKEAELEYVETAFRLALKYGDTIQDKVAYEESKATNLRHRIIAESLRAKRAAP